MADSRSWLIGADPSCDLSSDSRSVSGQHCRLTRTASGYLVEDLNSTNGTFVNGERINAATPVTRTDHITLGQSVAMPWPGEEPVTGDKKQVLSIGRAADNDIVIDQEMVSSHHAQIIVTDDRYLIKDLDSTNGTGIGSPRNVTDEAELNRTDRVFFGSHSVAASDLLKTIPPVTRHPVTMVGQSSGEIPIETFSTSSGKKSAISFSGQTMTFGRSPECHQVLDFPMISWEHATMTRSGSSITVKDLDSTNGTFVNGRAIIGATEVTEGDTISLGSFSFVLTADGSLKKQDSRGHLTLEAKGLAIDVPGLRLLEHISLTLNPAEFSGLMGPSGAGKTTLMKAMNGYTPPSEGEVFLNGSNLYQEFSQFRGQIGYVPQDDIIHSDLTVKQALYFTARLRLPPDFQDREIDRRIDQVLKDLGIEHTADVLIGSPEKKGISGGQRKRVNLAMELLTDPSLLFLDEPTSGLSSEDALSVMKVLRKLANDGKTILLTIHQPSLEVFQLLDNLVVVAKDQGSPDPGRLAYYGPAYPNSIEFFNPDGVPVRVPGMPAGADEVLRGLAQDRTNHWVDRYKDSPYHKKFVADRADTSASMSTAPSGAGQATQRPSTQWLPLVLRCVAIKMKDKANTLILLAQAPIIAILIWQIFGPESSKEMDDENWPDVAKAASTTVFLLSLSALWFGCSNSIREIVAEWAIYHRERMVNLRIVPYIGSKFAVLGTLCVVQCVCLLSIVHWGNGLEGSRLGILFILVLVSLVGLSIGLLVSALVRTSEAAVAILPLILLPMVMLSGVLIPLHKVGWAPNFLSYTMPSRWAFESTLLIESGQRISWTKPTVPGSGEVSQEQDMVENFFPEEDGRTSVFSGILAMLMMLGITVYAIYIILRRRDIHQT